MPLDVLVHSRSTRCSRSLHC